MNAVDNMKKSNLSKQNTCNAGEYYIASILSANGYTATITLGRAEQYDILAVKQNGKTIKLQVKTLRGSGPQWRMSPHNGESIENDLFFAFVRLNNMEKEPEYWIVPSEVVAKYIRKTHKKWLDTPGRKGQKHKDGPWRSFRIKSDRYTDTDWTENCKRYYRKSGLSLLS